MVPCFSYAGKGVLGNNSCRKEIVGDWGDQLTHVVVSGMWNDYEFYFFLFALTKTITVNIIVPMHAYSIFYLGTTDFYEVLC